MKKTASIIIVLFGLSSCVSLVNYQSGKTLTKGTTEVVASAEAIPMNNSNDDLVDVAISPGVSVYHGVSEKIDVGLRWEGGLAGSLGAKFQLLGSQSSKFALALDPRVGAFFYDVKDISPFTVVPGIISFHPTDRLAIIAAEEFLFIRENNNHYSFSHSLGFEYKQDNVKFVLGATSNYYGQGIVQFGVGLKYRF